MAAKQSQAWFSGGQQLGHSLPSVYLGFSPALHMPSLAKQSQVWSLVSVRPEPGQQAPAGHVHFGDLHPGQMGAWSPGLSSESQRE